MKTRVMAGVGGLALVAGLVASGGPAAIAVPTCYPPGYDGHMAVVSCLGSGQYRLAVRCYKAWPWETTWTKYSGWYTAPSSGTLIADCNTVTNDWKVWVERR